MNWLKQNIGEILIFIGLMIIPITTFFINVFAGFYTLAGTFILLGILYIKGGE